MKKLEFQTESLIKSSLTVEQFIILFLLHRKEIKIAEKLVVRTYGTSKKLYELLQEEGWLKITGTTLPKDVEIRQKFIELLNESTDMNIDSWVDEYRAIFKGKRPGAYGDRDLCIKHLTWLLTTYSEYSKEDVLKATKYYVSTCSKDGYKYLMQSNYFLSKQKEGGEVAHPILTYLEETKDKDMEIIEQKDFTTSL